MKVIKIVVALALLMTFSCKEKPQIENITALEFKTLLDKNDVQLIDVRRLDEFELGFIPKAKLINVKDANFSSKASNLNKSKPV